MNETLALKSPNVHAPDHTVWLAGLRLSPQDKKQAPLIVERRDQDFIEGLLADLANPVHAELRTKTPPRHDGMPRLFQPVQRVFNCVVLEAFCEMPGWPRVDPMRIESAGIVVRKLDGDKKLAWLKAGTKAHGWEAIDEDIDPKVDRRARAVSLGHTYLDE
ncbi:MAG TPA: hypothetical protein VFS42_04015 [Burkholderiaceae bacterium]|nr:hypothetical protein [Burkholderiaceae bacterium]